MTDTFVGPGNRPTRDPLFTPRHRRHPLSQRYLPGCTPSSPAGSCKQAYLPQSCASRRPSCGSLSPSIRIRQAPALLTRTGGRALRLSPAGGARTVFAVRPWVVEQASSVHIRRGEEVRPSGYRRRRRCAFECGGFGSYNAPAVDLFSQGHAISRTSSVAGTDRVSQWRICECGHQKVLCEASLGCLRLGRNTSKRQRRRCCRLRTLQTHLSQRYTSPQCRRRRDGSGPGGIENSCHISTWDTGLHLRLLRR